MATRQRWRTDAVSISSNYFAPDYDFGFPTGHSSPTASKRLVRNAVLGRNDDREPSFEWSVRKMIDCRLLGFSDGAQAVNYVGSHDVEGFRNERLFNFLQNNGIVLTEERIKLAFACLLTAVGVPMIFAGDEFADRHDLSVTHPPKQRDAVNFERVDEPFRQRVFAYVSRLVKLRTSSAALSVNDTDFIHVDFDDGKRVVVWRRGPAGSRDQVVVVANFSDFVAADAGSAPAEYRVPNWPATPADPARPARAGALGLAFGPRLPTLTDE